MSLSTFLTDLDAARVRFRQLLAGKRITVNNSATIINCLDLLADYWNISIPVVTPGRFNLYGSRGLQENISLIGMRTDLDHVDVDNHSFIENNTSVYNACVAGVLGKIRRNWYRPNYIYDFTPYQFENNSGWSKVCNSHAIRNGKLYYINGGEIFQAGSDSDWIDLKGSLGIRRGGYVYAIEQTALSQLDGSGGWKFVLLDLYSTGHTAVIGPDGKPYRYVSSQPYENLVKMSDISGDWTCITGFGNTEYTSSVRYDYAICDGKLYGGSTQGLSQLGISNQWSIVTWPSIVYSNGNPTRWAYGLCDGVLYRLRGTDTREILDSLGSYTDVINHYAVRNNRLIDCDTMTEITDRYVSKIFVNPAGVYWVGAAEYLTLDAPEELYLYNGETANDDPDAHEWTDDDVLSVRVLDGATALPTHCKGFSGVDFETDALSHLCAGYRVLCDVGCFITDGTVLTIQWLRGSTVVKTETRTFALDPEPRYFTRPAGEGNYSLKIGGTTVEAEVYYNDEWIDFPGGVLSSTYAGCPVRTKAAVAQDAIACWSDDGVDGDPFWYLI